VDLTMTRAVWRPRWWVWTSAGLAALATIHELTPARLQGHWLIITPLLMLACVLVVRRLWELPPAVTMCIAITLAIFSGAWRQIGLGGLPLDRLLIVVVLLQIFLRAPGAARMPPLQIRNVHLLMGLAVVYVMASAVAAGTLTNETGFLTLMDQFGVVPFLMFLVAPAVFAGQRERKWLLVTLVGLGAYLGFTAIFESLGPRALVFPHYILDVNTELGDERVAGPFQSSTGEGFATLGCTIAAVMAFVQWRGQRRRYFAALVAVVCIIGCFLTLERGVWIGVVAGVVVTALATQAGRRWLVPGAVIGALTIGGSLAVFSAVATKATTRVEDQASVWDRENQTSAGLRMFEARPLFGFGWNRYESDSIEYFRQAEDYPMIGLGLTTGVWGVPEKRYPLHDTYLSYAVELGLVGALLWLTSLLWGLGEAVFSRGQADLRPWKLGLLAMAVFFLVVSVFDPYQGPFPVLLLWVWAGVALGRAPLPARERRAKILAQTRSDVAWIPA
jgi:O-antigen ligase